MEDELLEEALDVSGNDIDQVSVDVSGNSIIINYVSPDPSTQREVSETLLQVRQDLLDSDQLTNSVFVRYSLSCTMIIVLAFMLFNHKR